MVTTVQYVANDLYFFDNFLSVTFWIRLSQEVVWWKTSHFSKNQIKEIFKICWAGIEKVIILTPQINQKSKIEFLKDLSLILLSLPFGAVYFDSARVVYCILFLKCGCFMLYTIPACCEYLLQWTSSDGSNIIWFKMDNPSVAPPAQTYTRKGDDWKIVRQVNPFFNK